MHYKMVYSQENMYTCCETITIKTAWWIQHQERQWIANNNDNNNNNNNKWGCLCSIYSSSSPTKVGLKDSCWDFCLNKPAPCTSQEKQWQYNTREYWEEVQDWYMYSTSASERKYRFIQHACSYHNEWLVWMVSIGKYWDVATYTSKYQEVQ